MLPETYDFVKTQKNMKLKEQARLKHIILHVDTAVLLISFPIPLKEIPNTSIILSCYQPYLFPQGSALVLQE